MLLLAQAYVYSGCIPQAIGYLEGQVQSPAFVVPLSDWNAPFSDDFNSESFDNEIMPGSSSISHISD